MSLLETEISCDTLSPMTLAVTIITLLVSAFVAYFKSKKQFCGKEDAPVEIKLTEKQRNRLRKIHMNVEMLVEQAGLTKASLS